MKTTLSDAPPELATDGGLPTTTCSASPVKAWRVSYDSNYGEYFVVEGNEEVRKTRANAELQAAAPKLLAALQSLLGVIDSHDIQTEDCDRRGHLYCDCLHRARKPALDAIREALGQNVKEHAPTPAGAHSETGVEVQTTPDSADKAAGGGCVARLVRILYSSAIVLVRNFIFRSLALYKALEVGIVQRLFSLVSNPLKLLNPLLCGLLGLLLSLGLSHADQITDTVDSKSPERKAAADNIELTHGQRIGSSGKSNQESSPSGEALPKAEGLDLHLLLVCFIFSGVVTMGFCMMGNLVVRLLGSSNSSPNVDVEASPPEKTL